MSLGEQHSHTSTSALTLKDGLELALVAGSNVTSHWAQFYVITFGLIGWLTSNLVRPDPTQVVILSVGAIAYYTLNAIATMRAYLVLNLIILETAEIAMRSNFANIHVRKTVVNKQLSMALPLRLPITALAHIAAAAAVIHLVVRSSMR